METVIGSARDLASFDPAQMRPKVLFESERMKAVLVALEPGQGIDVHAPQVDMAVAVLDGVGEVFADGRANPVRAGDIAVVPAGERRGVRALTERAVFLHVVAPAPTPELHDVEREPWPASQVTAAGPAEGIRAEHREILPHLEHLSALADEVPSLEPAEFRERLDGVLGFLRDVLLPHAGGEDATLYPVVDRVLRAVGGTTRTMSIDHRAVGALIDELSAIAEAEPTAASRRSAQRVLDGLDTLIHVHFDKEEEVYVPLLDLLSPKEAEELEHALDAMPGHAHAH